MRLVIVIILLLAGCAFVQVTEEVKPIDKDNIEITIHNKRIIPKEELMYQKKTIEGDIARAQQMLAKIEALLAQYK